MIFFIQKVPCVSEKITYRLNPLCKPGFHPDLYKTEGDISFSVVISPMHLS